MYYMRYTCMCVMLAGTLTGILPFPSSSLSLRERPDLWDTDWSQPVTRISPEELPMTFVSPNIHKSFTPMLCECTWALVCAHMYTHTDTDTHEYTHMVERE